MASIALVAQQVMEPKEDDQARKALALMQMPPVERERSGRNMWVGLITLIQPNLTAQQRQALADDYTKRFNHWYDVTYVDWYTKNVDAFQLVTLEDASLKPKPPPLNVSSGGKLSGIEIRDNKALCASTRIADCLSIVRQQPQATMRGLAPYADVLEQIAALADYDYYHMPLWRTASTPTPSFQHLFVPLSAHALTYINGDSNQALTGLCRDANTMRMLIRDGDDMIAILVASSVLRNNLHVAAQIIAELPLDAAALPLICDTAFAPLTAEEINLSLCSAMRGEHEAMRTFIELSKKQLSYGHMLPENEDLSDLDNFLLVDAKQKAAVCWPQIQETLRKDEKFVTPAIAVSTWPQQCRKRMLINKLLNKNNTAYGIACALSQTIPDIDYYASYVHKMQDVAAQLQMMQVLLWLRQQPDLPQPLTNDYLQMAVPANLYTSTQRPLTLSEDGNELKIPVYEERRPRDPCACVRLPLPQTLQ